MPYALLKNLSPFFRSLVPPNVLFLPSPFFTAFIPQVSPLPSPAPQRGAIRVRKTKGSWSDGTTLACAMKYPTQSQSYSYFRGREFRDKGQNILEKGHFTSFCLLTCSVYALLLTSFSMLGCMIDILQHHRLCHNIHIPHNYPILYHLS